VTPCPDECSGDCHYPNADYCCPKSGEAVCNIGSLEKRAFGYKRDGLPEYLEWFNGYNPDKNLKYQSLDYGHQAYYHGYNGQQEHDIGNKGDFPAAQK
jgi:hypothetical protein